MDWWSVSALQLDTLNWIEQLGPKNFHCLNLKDILKLSISVRDTLKT